MSSILLGAENAPKNKMIKVSAIVDHPFYLNELNKIMAKQIHVFEVYRKAFSLM